jgi:hypothetical protein
MGFLSADSAVICYVGREQEETEETKEDRKRGARVVFTRYFIMNRTAKKTKVVPFIPVLD